MCVDGDIIPRKTANYHPSIWGDFFISFTPDHTHIEVWREDAKNLKEKLGNILKEELELELELDGDEIIIGQKLGLIDAVERLGIGYHFEAEIEELLHKIRNIYDSNNPPHPHLLTESLLFRLLRQHGINFSCDIFNKFKDMKAGGFNKDMIGEDIEGILCLYEATFLRLHGEDILEEAIAYTKPILESKVASSSSSSSSSDLTPYLSELVRHALQRPVRKAYPRVATSQYISIYQLNEMHNQTLLNFAKIDFNLLQLQHLKELRIISMWWRDLEVEKMFPFTRDRITELYLWILGVYYEPRYDLSRKFLCKVIAICSIMDDIYDVYGTPPELEIFTNVLRRWDSAAVDELPAEYMKIFYGALLKVYDEMEKEVGEVGGSFGLSCAKESLIRTAEAYHAESKWLEQTTLPSMEEYLEIARATSAYPMLAVASLVGMGEIATKEAFAWFMNNPPIINAAALICRLMDDIVSHKLEKEREHVASGVQCYMNEHNVSDEGEAYENFNKQIEEAWVDINEAFMDPDVPASTRLLTRVLNLVRVMDLFYKSEDAYTCSHNLKPLILALLINPIPIPIPIPV